MPEGAVAFMARSKHTKGKSGASSASKEIKELKARNLDLQMEVDILKEIINVLKKDQDVNKILLTNKEKAAIVDVLKSKYKLPKLYAMLDIHKNTYYYRRNKRLTFRERHKEDFRLIAEIFNDNYCCYGYRRIKAELDSRGHIISEKVIRRLMKVGGLVAIPKKAKKYNSYLGEISPAVPDLIRHDFHASKPNEKWLTDITEFSIPAGKVYLSPIIDCFDGMPVSWRISTSPNARLVNEMLDEAISKLPQEAHPIVHSDRGCHYRWPDWIKRMDEAGLVRSMSRKGCSPDNAACEGFFGRLKNEFFHGNDWDGISIQEFIVMLDKYLVWYRDKRIKISLGSLSPRDYRQYMGVAA